MSGPLRTPAFRKLWLAGLLSLTGSEMSRLAFVLYLFQLRGGVGDLALFIAVRTVAAALAAPAAGVIVDRFDKRSAMIACDLARFTFLIAVLVDPTPLVVYVMSACDAVAGAVFEPARTAAIPLVVSRSDVTEANGAYRAAASVTMIVGPVAGAELFAAGGLAPALIVDASTYLVSAALIAGMKLSRSTGEARDGEGVLQAMTGGWQVLARHDQARQLTGLFLVSMLCGGLWLPLAPFFIRDHLGAADRLLGWQFSAFGVGGVAGGLLAARLARRFDKGFVVVAALMAEGLLMTSYAIVAQPVVSSVILFGWGVSVAVMVVTGTTILQTTVPSALLGRVFAIVHQVENCAVLMAMYLAVALGDAVGARAMFLAAGVTYVWVVAASTMTRSGRALRLTH